MRSQVKGNIFARATRREQLNYDWIKRRIRAGVVSAAFG
jgi:hypothetical protein